MTPTCINLRERRGGEVLAVELNGRPKTAKKVAAIPGIVIHQDGDDEKTYLFPVSLFDLIAALVEPKRIRRLGEEHKAKLLKAGRKFRFKHGSGARSAKRQDPDKPKGGQEVAENGLQPVLDAGS
jgi:hypothetical protein